MKNDCLPMFLKHVPGSNQIEPGKIFLDDLIHFLDVIYICSS
jgi:hypothetical protein